jgi:arylsulfatase A-like enzyme
LNVAALSLPMGRGFVCSELLLAVFPILFLVGPALALDRWRRPKNLFLRIVWKAALFSGAAFFLFLAGGSWATFVSTGRFLDLDGVAFLMTNQVMLLQHVAQTQPYELVAAPFLAAATAALAISVLREISRWNWIAHLSLSAVAALALIAALHSSLFLLVPSRASAEAVPDPDAGMVFTYQDLYQECRDQRSGPLTHLWADLRERYFSAEDALADSPDVPVRWDPILPMVRYVESVDPRREKKWNVIVVLVESLRWDQLRAGGSPVSVMPNVEALAADGRVYTRNYCQATHSNYADNCPLSSHYPLRSPRSYVYPKNPTYPRVLIYDILKALGYRTAVISSQNESWGKMSNYLQTGNIDHFFDSETFEGPTYVPYRDTGFEAFVKGKKRAGKIDDRYTAAEAVRWIDEGGGKPFFIYMNLQTSHVPYEVPSDFPRRFGPEKLPFSIQFNNFPPKEAAVVKQVYANSLAYVDYQLGKVIEHLKGTGEWDHTIICVTGDNGQAFYEHGFAAHANKLYDEDVRVPIVLRAPGFSPSVDNRLTEHLDIPPTILGLLGLPPHPSFQGLNLLDPAPAERSVYLVVQSPLAHQYAIVRSDFKYLYDADRKSEALFDLKNDPGETRNEIASHPDLAKSLSGRLNTWRKEQIDYYQNIGRHKKFYPPKLAD